MDTKKSKDLYQICISNDGKDKLNKDTYAIKEGDNVIPSQYVNMNIKKVESQAKQLSLLVNLEVEAPLEVCVKKMKIAAAEFNEQLAKLEAHTDNYKKITGQAFTPEVAVTLTRMSTSIHVLKAGVDKMLAFKGDPLTKLAHYAVQKHAETIKVVEAKLKPRKELVIFHCDNTVSKYTEDFEVVETKLKAQEKFVTIYSDKTVLQHAEDYKETKLKAQEKFVATAELKSAPVLDGESRRKTPVNGVSTLPFTSSMQGTSNHDWTKPENVSKTPLHNHVRHDLENPVKTSSDADSNVHFCIVIPKDIGWETVLAYLGHPHLQCGMRADIRRQFRIPLLTDDRNLANHVECAGDISCYPSIIVNGVRGILLKCREGSKTEGGSFDAILGVLKLANKRQWPLKAIFLVGCCKSITGSIPEGTLIMAKKCVECMVHLEAQNKYESREHSMIESNGRWRHAFDWCSRNYGIGQDCQISYIVSGTFFINDPRQARALRDDLQPLPENTCIEEEANGLVTAVHCCHELTPLKPDVIILKGVCCNAGQPMRPDHQSECTLKSFSMILKAINYEFSQHDRWFI